MRSSWGERIVERLAGRPVAWLAREAQIGPRTLAEIISKATPNAEFAVRIAQALGVTVEWLITGKEAKPRGSLRSADDAEWVSLPYYELAGFTEEGKPEPSETISIRRDWLYAHARRSKRLFLTDLPFSIHKDLGPAGTTILCEDLQVRDGDGFFLYFYDCKPLVRHFTPLSEAEIAKATLQLDEDPPGMRLAARILGPFGLRPL